MLGAANQAAYPLKRQFESQGRAFEGNGGFTERLYCRHRQRWSDWTDNAYR